LLSIGQGFVERHYGRGTSRGPAGPRLFPRAPEQGAATT
jgi:hypothetical protein